MTPETFQEAVSVSRETLDRLVDYAELLRRWQARINLVGPRTLDELWERHLLDSAQLFPLLPPRGPVFDLGSGAGLPGIVLAIMGAEDVHLVESDSRKAAFLREAARVTRAPAAVHNVRIEALPPRPAAAVTARALAPLDQLLAWAAPLLGPDTVCIFPKGRQVDEELTAASKAWKMRVDRFPSRTDPSGTVLRLSEISRV